MEWLIKTIQVNSEIAKIQKNKPAKVANKAQASSVHHEGADPEEAGEKGAEAQSKEDKAKGGRRSGDNN